MEHPKLPMIDAAIEAIKQGQTVEIELSSGNRFASFTQLSASPADNIYSLVVRQPMGLASGQGGGVLTSPQTETWFHLDDLAAVSFT